MNLELDTAAIIEDMSSLSDQLNSIIGEINSTQSTVNELVGNEWSSASATQYKAKIDESAKVSIDYLNNVLEYVKNVNDLAVQTNEIESQMAAAWDE